MQIVVYFLAQAFSLSFILSNCRGSGFQCTFTYSDARKTCEIIVPLFHFLIPPEINLPRRPKTDFPTASAFDYIEKQHT